MRTGRYEFDHRALLAAVEAHRERYSMSWADVGRETDLAPPTFHRLVHGRSLSANTLATLMAWLGTPMLYSSKVEDEP